ncbi:GNAT family N-acetyltransferase, partial [Muriicola sp.]|uniref:GNAT family N-acetyltransferase n=1 Tax=Muriicola sp. TaxID=2020856 RepID=UPI003C74AFBA
MAIEFTRVSRQEELAEILALQEQNLATNLTEKEIEKEGFVTVSHTLDLLSKMNAICPHIIAKDKGRVIGYALCMHPDFSREIPVLLSMFEQIGEVVPTEQSYLVMGQVCIDKAYRGKGIFRGLYKTMKRSL